MILYYQAEQDWKETTTEDFAIPFIRVLQSNSPQVNKQKGEYVEGAEVGKLFNDRY